MGYAMNEEQHQVLRRQMMQVISIYVEHASNETGKERLDSRVQEVIGNVPRHEFVPGDMRPYAYFDGPLPIGYEKTISQPFMVALMTDLLEVDEENTVLEVGTGLGYHAAILAGLAEKVFTVEIVEELAVQAKENLRRLGYDNVEMKVGNGSTGWPEHAPFDNILVAAAPEIIPPSLINQLKPGGKMVVPAGIADAQQLMLVEKSDSGKLSTKEIIPVRFSPLEVIN